MKTRFLLPLWLAISALSVFSCSPELAEELSLTEQETIDPEIIALIEEMGFKTDDIYITDDAYIIEGDIIISKERLKELKDKPQTRHTYYSGYGHIISQTWLNDNKETNGKSKIYIGVEYSSNWPASTKKDAMKRYYDVLSSVIRDFDNVADFAINLERLDAGIPDIYIRYATAVSMNSNRFLVTDIPLNGEPGSTIYINPRDTGMAWSDKTEHPDGKIRASLVHAIGHCLGLGHTGTHEGSGSSMGEDNYAQDQTDLSGDLKNHSDAGSIMHPNNTYTGGGPSSVDGILSEGDKVALWVLYPTFSGGYIYVGNQRITAGATPASIRSTQDAVGGSGPITYKWQKSLDSRIWEDIPNTNSTTYQPPALIETTYYKRLAISGGETKESDVVYIIVIPNPGVIAGNQTIMSGATPTLLTSVNDAFGSPSPTYQWQMRESNADWRNVPSNGTSNTYQPPALIKSTDYQRVAKSGDQKAASNTVSVTVIQLPIDGPDFLEIHTAHPYSCEPVAGMPAGATFHQWTVTGGAYDVIEGLNQGLNYPWLIIIFREKTTYTLTATYRLPDGSFCNSTPKTVIITVPTPPMPVIECGNQKITHSGANGYDCYWSSLNGQYVTFSVRDWDDYTNYHWSSDKYESQTAPYYNIYAGSFYGNTLLRIQCRAERYGVYSQPWIVYLYVSNSPYQTWSMSATVDSLAAPSALVAPREMQKTNVMVE